MKKTRLLAGALSAVLLMSGAWKAGTGDVRADVDVNDTDADVAIDETNFPDEIFRNFVAENYDADDNGKLNQDEIRGIQAITLNESGVKDVTGIGFFTYLQQFWCDDCPLTTLDVSQNEYLMVLSVRNCKLTKLDLRKNVNLAGFDCSQNQLTELNISGLTQLQIIQCNVNQIAELDISSCSGLMKIECSGNKISKLDLSKCSQVDVLSCARNEISSLDLSGLPLLTDLYCGTNKLTELNLSKQSQLKSVSCEDNKITSLKLGTNPDLVDLCVSGNKIGKLDVSSLANLENLACNECGLSELDVSHNTKLKGLWCYENTLSKLDISNSPSLENLNCSVNPLEKLDVSKNTRLKNLYAYECGLTSLDVTKCTKLVLLDIFDNELKALDLSANTDLEELICCDNQLTELDLSKLVYLKDVDCSYNKIAKLSLAKAEDLEGLRCHYNTISNLDISGCTSLIERLKENGIKEAPEGYFYSEIDIDGDKWAYFAVDMGVDLKGYTLPKANTFKDFVERLYTVALNRSSDPEGKAFWVEKVQNGEYNGADCARFFLLEAPEFMNRGLSVNDFVETLYKTFFDRASDAAGKKGWVDAINSGKMSRADVVNNFIESTEWCNVCATYGVRSGAIYHKSEIASRNATRFATRLYTCCLCREPEEKGLQYWALALTNLEQTGCSAAKLFFTSDEFVNFHLKDDEYIRRLYTTFMDRNPEESEVAYWTGEIAKGTQTRDSVLAFFGTSDEFTVICAKYGIERGTI